MDIDTQVAEFHRAFGYPVRSVPAVPEQEEQILRLRLIAEEFFELLEAHRIFAATDDGAGVRGIVMNEIDALRQFQWSEQTDLPAVADALADLDYVIAGTRLTYGIPGAEVAEEVHAANLAKKGGKPDEHGKLQKPAWWKPPDIEGVLKRAGWKP